MRLIHFDLPIFPWRLAEEKKRDREGRNLKEVEKVEEVEEVEEVERSAERLEVAIRTLVSRDLSRDHLPSQVHLVLPMIIVLYYLGDIGLTVLTSRKTFESFHSLLKQHYL